MLIMSILRMNGEVELSENGHFVFEGERRI